MSYAEVDRVVPHGPVRVGSRRLAAILIPFALAAPITGTSWAVPRDPVPVRDNPNVSEGVPTAHGSWVGWVQNTQTKPAQQNFYVQRAGHPRIKVNGVKTQSSGGGIVGGNAYYVQRSEGDTHIVRFNLKTGQRKALPAKVNHYHHTTPAPCCGGPKRHVVSGVRGNATVSGAWLLYSGDMDGDKVGYYYTVMLYNRVTERLRTLAEGLYDDAALWAGQVNGNYATYWSYDGTSALYRYGIKTKRSVELPLPDSGDPYDPAVSSDGTVYYFVTDAEAPSGGPYNTELVRQPVEGPAAVVTALTTATRETPRETFVKDRSDGSRVVFFSWKGDVYRLVDNSPG